MRGRALSLGLALLTTLAACSSDSEQRAPLLETATRLSGTGPNATPRFAARLSAGAPVLQIGFVETKQSANLLLERRHGEFDYWISVEGAHVILQSGMLHGTRGFGEGLLASDLSAPLALVLARRSGQADRFHTYLDGNDRAVTRTYRCRIDNDGPQQIELATGPVATTLMTERCRSLDQSFVNFYWVSAASGQIVQSRQWAGPRLGSLSTRVVPN